MPKSYLSEAAWITRKLLVGIKSESLFRFNISNSHSSSIQLGDSSNKEMSISWTSRGVDNAISPGFTLFKQNADIDSWSLCIIRTGSDTGTLWLFEWPSTARFRMAKHLVDSKSKSFIHWVYFLPLPEVTSFMTDGATEPFSLPADVERFLPNTARMNISWTGSWRTKKFHSRRAGAEDAWIGLNGVLLFSSRDRYLWIAGPLTSVSMKQPGIKSSGAGPRSANSSFRTSIQEFNRRRTPWVNGLATGSSVEVEPNKLNGLRKRTMMNIFLTLHFNTSNSYKIL